MEHKDGQYMQSTESFVNSNMENMQQQQQQHLNVAGCDVVSDLVGVGVIAGDVGNKYDEHQHEEHDVGDDNESKYVKEVQQSEKQQTLKEFDDNDFEVKEKALNCGTQLLDNGDSRTVGMSDGVDSSSLLGFDFDSNRDAYGMNAEYEKMMQTKNGDENIFGNDLSNYKNITDSAKHYSMHGMDTDSHLSAMKSDGDFPISSVSESIDTDNVPQVDVKIETAFSQNYVSEHDMADEEEPSSLADNTTNGTSSLSENAPQPVIEDQLPTFPIASRTLSLSIEDKENVFPTSLNPDAKEFIPSCGSNPNSPTSPMPVSTGLIHTNKTEGPLTDTYYEQFDGYPNITNRHLLSEDDEVVAESPRKGQVEDMDNISLPSELNEFAKEASRRPHEFQPEECNEALEQGETILNNVNGDNEMESRQDNNSNGLNQYNNQSISEFNKRMTYLVLNDNSESTMFNEYLTGVHASQINDQVNQYPQYSTANDDDDDDDVMRRSVYLSSGQPIEDVLNKVQLLPTDIGSENTSFDESVDDNPNDNANDNPDINNTINLPNKESLQVEEKEHVSHSPSTEEMNIDLHGKDDEQLFYKPEQQQKEQQQQQQQTNIDSAATAEIESTGETKEIDASDNYNNQSDDIIIIDDDDDDDEVACVPPARDSSGMMLNSSAEHDDHFSQEKQIETCTSMVMESESDYHSQINTVPDNQAQFERNLENYINEPLTVNQQEVSDDDEVPPTKMIVMEIGLDKDMLKEKAYEAANRTYLCDTVTQDNQMAVNEKDIFEAKPSEKLFTQAEIPPTESVKVDFALEATNDMNDEKILNTDFGKSSMLPSTEYNNGETDTSVIVAETVTEVVECIQLDDTIESVEEITNEKAENESKCEELFAEKLLENVNLREAKNEVSLAQEAQLLEDGITKLLATEEKMPCEMGNTKSAVVPAVAATVAAVSAVTAGAAAVRKPTSVKGEKNNEISKKSAMAANKPSSGTVGKATKSTTSVTSARTVGSVVKKTSGTNAAKASTSATTKPTAKPKVPTTEKDISEKKPGKVFSKTTTAVKATTTSSGRPASARPIPSSVSSKTSVAATKTGLGTTGQKTGATATAGTAKTRPATAPSTTSLAPAKPTTLGLTDAAKPKARSPRSTLTTQARKAAAAAAKSPVKLPSVGINGTGGLKSTTIKATPRTSGGSNSATVSTTTTTTNKLFTARPAPKFTNPTVTTTTTITKRTITATTAAAKNSLSVGAGAGNKTNAAPLSKTSPTKLAATANKAPSRTSTGGTTKAKSTSAPSSASSAGKISSSKNTTPKAIKKPQPQQQEGQKQQQQIDQAIVSPTIALLNGDGDHSETELKDISNLTNGDPQAFLDDTGNDHNTSAISLSDA